MNAAARRVTRPARPAHFLPRALNDSMAKAIDIPDCGSVPAAEGALVVLRTRLEEVLSFRDAALDWSDIEGVHDMRVATRRLRSISRDFGRYLPKVSLKKFRRAVKGLADALGEVRDEDVALAAVEERARQAPPELRAGFERVAAPKRARRKRARVQLFGALEAETFAAFGEDLSAFLKPRPARQAEGQSGQNKFDDSRSHAETAEPAGDDGDARGRDENRSDVAALTFREAGREVVERHLRQLVKQSASLFRPHDSEGLHDLRIASKELRYSLELFSGCWGGELKPLAKEIARLQSSLGHVHDCDIWMAELGKWLSVDNDKLAFDSSRAASDASGVERRAALWLFRRYADERAEHLAAALARWHAWENYQLLAHVREALRPGGENAEPASERSSPEVAAAHAAAPEGHKGGG